MNVFWADENESSEKSLLVGCALGAFALEAVVLTLVGWNGHWLAHDSHPPLDAGFVEAQVFEMPKAAHLVAAQKSVAIAKPEATLSKVADQGRKAKAEEHQATDEQNQTTSGGEVTPPTHGPLAVYSPSPKIPSYLREQDIHSSVVIDFLVSSLGHVTVRLVGSSGNDELDALAIATAEKWQFKPAEKDHHALDAKVRLRINFDVQ